MIEDYYAVLELNRECTQAELYESYRQLAIVWDPLHSLQDKNLAESHFARICEAFEVLSNPFQRAYYDKYGYELFKTFLYSNATLSSGHHFGGTHTLNNFMRNPDTVDLLIDRSINRNGSCFGAAFGGLKYIDSFRPQNLVVEISCTLEELYCGSEKQILFTRKCLCPDGRETQEKIISKMVKIKANTANKAILRYVGQGHESVHRVTSDLQLVVNEMPHSSFQRQGNNLVHFRTINLSSALSCKSIDILTLDGQILKLSIDHIITPNTFIEIPQKGFTDQSNVKGSLFIRFSVVFPSVIPAHAKAQLRNLLK